LFKFSFIHLTYSYICPISKRKEYLTLKMGLEEDVFKIGKKLEKKISNDECDSALDVLERLKDCKMTLEVLQKTKIGMTVNNLRKQTKDDQVISTAKALIKSWKKLLPAQDNAASGGGSTPSKGGGATMETSSSSGGADLTAPDASLAASKSGGEAEKKEADAGGDSGSSTPKEESEASGNEGKSGSVSEMVSYTSDPVRLKCREMLCTALQANKPADSEGMDYKGMGGQIEDAIFDHFGDTGMKYKNCVRSRVFNLKDPKNPMLSRNVMCGLISSERLATMTSEDMASSEMKTLRDEFTKEGIKDHQMAKTGGTNTSLFKCGRCLKSNCSYNQLQTRSADEPMTTFVFCNECGHRWKFC